MVVATGGPNDPFEHIRRMLEESGQLARFSEVSRQVAALFATPTFIQQQAAIAKHFERAFDDPAIRAIEAASTQVMAPALQAIAEMRLPELSMPVIPVIDLPADLFETALPRQLEDLLARHADVLAGLDDQRATEFATSVDEIVDSDRGVSFAGFLQELLASTLAGVPGATEQLIAAIWAYRAKLFIVLRLYVLGMMLTTYATADDPHMNLIVTQVGLATDIVVELANLAAKPKG